MTWRVTLAPLLLVAGALMGMIGMTACTAPRQEPQKSEEPPAAGGPVMPNRGFILNSPAFAEGAAIPARHTCDGQDVSPDLQWTDPPAGTTHFVLIVDDADAPAGTWVHWVVFDIPGDARGLPQAIPPLETLPAPVSARQGCNDFGKVGWGGPCPPPGKPHRYSFRLYALDRGIGLAAGVAKADVERAMRGHVMGQAELSGTYGRGR